MSDSDERELNELTEIYDVLKTDAKRIIRDLHGGVAMWREAAAGSLTSALFIVILILTAFHYQMFGGAGLEFWAYIVGASALALVTGAISLIGFRKYYQLRRRYAGLFSRAKMSRASSVGEEAALLGASGLP